MSDLPASGNMSKFQHLVVDTTAFIKNVQLQNIAEKCYTVPGVVKEIKHDRHLRRLVVLPYQLQVRQPDPDVLAKVAAFAKKTGDFASLSMVDLHVIALTYELHKVHVGEEQLRKEPKTAITVANPEKPLALQSTELTKGFYVPKKSHRAVDEPTEGLDTADAVDQQQEVGEDSDADEEVGHEDGKHVEEEYDSGADSDGTDNGNDGNDKESDDDDGDDGDDDDDDDDDEDSWITPSNIAQVKRDYGMDCLEEAPSTVACMTTDFAIQNVLKQIGLQIAALDGRVIRQSRTYILRCYACFKTTSDSTKMFCPRCGNNTLKKVAVSLDENGQQVIHINSRRPLTAKYKNRPVAKFAGGKHAANPVLYEDQPLPQQHLSRKARAKTNALAADFTAGASPFVMRDIDSRSAVLRGSSDIKQRMKNLDYDNKRRGYNKWAQ
uniref:RNA-binding protein NOB1 n=1 Tax=Anopheles atroparvus TaxID=41427 RepID=A0A182J1F0_ANOAO